MRTFVKCAAIMAAIIIMAPLAWAGPAPILYFSFDEAVGDVVKDMSGGGHDGILKEGAAIVADKMVGSGALQIEGGLETMEVETFKELEEYDDHTYIFWIKFTDPVSGAWDQILAKPAPASDRSPGLWVNTTGLGIHYRYEPGNMGASKLGAAGEESDFPEGEWFHVAGVKEGEELILYVNGSESFRVPVPAEFAQGAAEDMAGLYVGKSQSYGGDAGRFIIDDLAIFDQALSANQVASIFGGGITPVDAKEKLATVWGSIKQ